MPVTARLSKLFYDRLGEEIAQELVDWFNSVDATYRANLRELNELNFGRFDAKVGERLAELRAQLREEVRDLIKAGLVPLEARLTSVETRMTALETKMTAFQVDLEGRTQSLRTEIERSKSSLIKWMFVFWAPTALAMIGLFLKG